MLFNTLLLLLLQNIDTFDYILNAMKNSIYFIIVDMILFHRIL
jgi:hypothetical protein